MLVPSPTLSCATSQLTLQELGCPAVRMSPLQAGCGFGTPTQLLEAPGAVPSKEPGREERCQLLRRLGCHSYSLSLLASSLASSLAPSGPACSRLPAISARSMSLQGHGHGSRCSRLSRAPPGLPDLPRQGHPAVPRPPCHGHHSQPGLTWSPCHLDPGMSHTRDIHANRELARDRDEAVPEHSLSWGGGISARA